MSDSFFKDFDQSNVSDLFDQDYGRDFQFPLPDGHVTPSIDLNTFSSFDHFNHIFDHHDPLKYVYKFKFKPFHLNVDNLHFVKPHYVDSYVRKDGTVVQGYWRDGDGDTSINRMTEQGGGYLRSNPDHTTLNNLKSNL
ncbi:hypothetical protein HNQ82_002150 [Anoxybacillus tengchongensis]|uniref:Uncharacterized protein n=1 Tax=Anoxybacillus tengchongensis TaxID=576944 RepID=A0A7X0DA19_9BACL|nr:hypothetical protein [Anoxybacillus tengchongensis]MBB6177317.1 hypothetical protein [Anoxybacillus tengchongensis]